MKNKPQMMMIPTDRNGIPLLLKGSYTGNDRFYYYNNIQMQMIDYAVYNPAHPAAVNGFRVEKRPAYCVYVNSQSCNGDLEQRLVYKDFTACGPVETGDGSKKNPFINLNSVMWEMTSDSGYLNCLGKNCIRICVIVSGIVDYYVSTFSIYTQIDDLVFDFRNADVRLIREDELEVSGKGSPYVSAIKYIDFYHPLDFYLYTNLQIQHLNLSQHDEFQSELVKENKYDAMVPCDLSVSYNNFAGGGIGLREVYWDCRFSLEYTASTDQSSEYVDDMLTTCKVVVFDSNGRAGAYNCLLGCTVDINTKLDIKALHKEFYDGVLHSSYYNGRAAFRCSFHNYASTCVIANCKINIASNLTAKSGSIYCINGDCSDWHKNRSSTYFYTGLLGGANAEIIGSEISVTCSADAGKGEEYSVFEHDGTIRKANSTVTDNFHNEKDRDWDNAE